MVKNASISVEPVIIYFFPTPPVTAYVRKFSDRYCQSEGVESGNFVGR